MSLITCLVVPSIHNNFITKLISKTGSSLHVRNRNLPIVYLSCGTTVSFWSTTVSFCSTIALNQKIENNAPHALTRTILLKVLLPPKFGTSKVAKPPHVKATRSSESNILAKSVLEVSRIRKENTNDTIENSTNNIQISTELYNNCEVYGSTNPLFLNRNTCIVPTNNNLVYKRRHKVHFTVGVLDSNAYLRKIQSPKITPISNNNKESFKNRVKS